MGLWERRRGHLRLQNKVNTQIKPIFNHYKTFTERSLRWTIKRAIWTPLRFDLKSHSFYFTYVLRLFIKLLPHRADTYNADTKKNRRLPTWGTLGKVAIVASSHMMDWLPRPNVLEGCYHWESHSVLLKLSSRLLRSPKIKPALVSNIVVKRLKKNQHPD